MKRPLSSTTYGYGYNTNGLYQSINRPNGVVSTHQYTQAGRLLQIVHQKGNGDLLAVYTYTYDAAGNRIAAIENVAPLDAAPGGGTDTFAPASGSNSVVVTVKQDNASGEPLAGVWVRAANNSDQPTDATALTDGNGQASLSNLADGAYRFCANVGGYTACSAPAADCTLPGCTSKEIIASAPGQARVTVVDGSSARQPLARVSAFVGDTDTGVSAVTGLGGFATFPLRCTRGRASTLPQGSYRFKVEQNGQTAWSDAQVPCAVPGCNISVATAGSMITYEYDNLGRLTQATYPGGEYFQYEYDRAGNRKTETVSDGVNTPITTTSTYDDANRLTQAGSQAYTWDTSGNLLNDGVRTYVYTYTNRLTGVVQGTDVTTYYYNGLGDRVSQTTGGQTTQYTLDMNAGLTQVLDDGTTATCTEIDRIAHDNRLKRPLNTLNYVDYTDAEPAEWWHFEPYGK